MTNRGLQLFLYNQFQLLFHLSQLYCKVYLDEFFELKSRYVFYHKFINLYLVMTERHIIKISVDLKSAKLLVRFPCKLTFQLKTDSSSVESRTPFELKKGECVIN